MKPEQYNNELNLIAVNTDGIEVIIEMPGDVGDFIDILVRSRKTAKQTRAFLVQHVFDEMRSFCASPEGNGRWLARRQQCDPVLHSSTGHAPSPTQSKCDWIALGWRAPRKLPHCRTLPSRTRSAFPTHG